MSFWENLWNIIVVFFWAFVFIAALMALFMVLVDLFRNKNVNGWVKALWIIALVFLPVITCLVYILTHSQGMAERSAKEAKDTQSATEEYIRKVAGTSKSDELAKAKNLLDSGAIDDSEYAHLKQAILAGSH